MSHICIETASLAHMNYFSKADLLLAAVTSTSVMRDHSVSTFVPVKPQNIFNTTRTSTELNTGAALLLAL